MHYWIGRFNWSFFVVFHLLLWSHYILVNTGFLPKSSLQEVYSARMVIMVSCMGFCPTSALSLLSISRPERVLGHRCASACDKGHRLMCLGPKPSKLEMCGSQESLACCGAVTGVCSLVVTSHQPWVTARYWEYTTGSKLSGQCHSHMKDTIWGFLQNLHLRGFTFNIFLKQCKEQKKKKKYVYSSCKVCRHFEWLYFYCVKLLTQLLCTNSLHVRSLCILQ